MARLEATQSDRRLWMGGSYLQIVPAEKIVFDFAWLNPGKSPGPRSTISVTLAPEGTGTRQIFQQAAFETTAARDQHVLGWGECLDRLATLTSRS